MMYLFHTRYVVLVSGLNLGSSWCDQLSVEMFVDYVTGQLGTPAVRMSSHVPSSYVMVFLSTCRTRDSVLTL